MERTELINIEHQNLILIPGARRLKIREKNHRSFFVIISNSGSLKIKMLIPG